MIEILRLSHRLKRDVRVSTHCALASRALGASKIYYSGQHDSSYEDSVNKIVSNWGGDFTIEYVKNPIELIKAKKRENYLVVHLTCYGLELNKEIVKIRKNKKILVVVGSEKVPPEIYHLADINLSIGNTPHSEISALSIFLYEFFGKDILNKNFKNAKIKIIPSKIGKRVIKSS